MTFMMAIGTDRMAVGARAAMRPAARPALVLVWHPAPDGRGLVARWVEAVEPWYAPVGLRARPPAARRPLQRSAALRRAA